MPKVTITPLSTVREKIGWTVREFDCEGASVADLFKLVQTKDDGTLHDLLIDGDQMRPGYLVLINGEKVDSPHEVLKEGDQLVAVEVLMIIAGGEVVF